MLFKIKNITIYVVSFLGSHSTQTTTVWTPPTSCFYNSLRRRTILGKWFWDTWWTIQQSALTECCLTLPCMTGTSNCRLNSRISLLSWMRVSRLWDSPTLINQSEFLNWWISTSTAEMIMHSRSGIYIWMNILYLGFPISPSPSTPASLSPTTSKSLGMSRISQCGVQLMHQIIVRLLLSPSLTIWIIHTTK